MARSRNIKPGFFQNDELAELDPIDRLCFIGLWTICDFKGCLEFRPKKIKAQILPYDNADVKKIAINLDKSGFISIYSVQGIQYLKILNFSKHQNPHKNERAAGSDIPDLPDDATQAIDLNEVTINPDLSRLNQDKDGTAPADSLLLIPDSLKPIPSEKTLDQSSIDELFNIFYLAYPKKTDKENARKRLNTILKNKTFGEGDELITLITENINARLASGDWRLGEDKQYIPGPAKYLLNKLWQDEIIGGSSDDIHQIKSWRESWAGIVAKGAELGIAQNDNEHDQTFKARVMDAAGGAA